METNSELKMCALLLAAVKLQADFSYDRDEACAAARQFWFTLEQMEADARDSELRRITTKGE